jgi:benzaldehyde dehydrogenase (NAD)
MAAFDEESFGPVTPITTFRNDEQAIAIDNATDYGLTSAVVSAVVSADRAPRIADELHSRRCRRYWLNRSDRT